MLQINQIFDQLHTRVSRSVKSVKRSLGSFRPHVRHGRLTLLNVARSMSSKPDMQHKHATLTGLDSYAMDRWLSEAGSEAPWSSLIVAEEKGRSRGVQLSRHDDAARSSSLSGATWGSVTEAEGKVSHSGQGNDC